MAYGYFEGLSWWPWILTAIYTFIVLAIVIRAQSFTLGYAVYAGPLVTLFSGIIEVLQKGI